MLGDKESENSEVIEQLLKERIVDHPEDAGSVLGKEGAAALQEQLENIKDKRDRAVVEEIIKQNFKANASYAKSIQNITNQDSKKYIRLDSMTK